MEPETRRGTPRWRTPGALAFAAAVFVCWFQLVNGAASPVYLDDSLITMRVAKMAAEGRGLVFNEGERVMVYSNPGYVLLLAGLGRLGLSIPAAVWATFFGFGMALPVAAGLMVRRVAPAAMGALAVLVLFRSEGMWFSTKGMETAMFLALSAGSFAALLHGRTRVGALAAGIAALCRPDAMVVPVLYLLVQWLEARERRRELAVSAAIIAAIGLAWASASLSLYGTVVPNTMKAKWVHRVMGGQTLFRSLRTEYLRWGLVAVATAALAVPLARRAEHRTALAAASFGLANLALLIAGRAPHFHWYVVPALFSLLLLGSIGAFRTADWIAGGKGRRWILSCAVVAAAIWVARNAALSSWPANLSPRISDAKSAPARFIAAHRREGEWVAGDDVGFLGYYSGGYVFDTKGLLQDFSHPFLADGNRLGMLEKYRPAWICGDFSVPGRFNLVTNYLLRRNDENYPVWEKIRWDDAAVWRESPGLAAALRTQGQAVVFDFPRLAASFDDFAAFASREVPGARLLSGERGAVERSAAALLRGTPSVRWSVEAGGFVAAPEVAALATECIVAPDYRASAVWSLSGARLRLSAAKQDAGPDGLPIMRPVGANPVVWYGGPAMPGARRVAVSYRFVREARPTPVWRSGTLWFESAESPGMSSARECDVNLLDDGATHVAVFDLATPGCSARPLVPGERLSRLGFDPVGPFIGVAVELRSWRLMAE